MNKFASHMDKYNDINSQNIYKRIFNKKKFNSYLITISKFWPQVDHP